MLIVPNDMPQSSRTAFGTFASLSRETKPCRAECGTISSESSIPAFSLACLKSARYAWIVRSSNNIVRPSSLARASHFFTAISPSGVSGFHHACAALKLPSQRSRLSR
jgi:hypothetical protein